MEKELIYFEKFDLPISVHHLCMTAGGDYRGMHSHKAVEIIEVKSGVLNCHIGSQIVPVHPGQILFVNSNVGHRLTSENAEVSYMNIDTSLLEEGRRDDEFAILSSFISHTQANPYLIFRDNEEITELLGKIQIKYWDDAKESRWYLKAYLYELMAFMYAQSFLVPLTISGEEIKKIEQVVRYVHENFKMPITLDDICASVKYSKYTVCHNFKGMTGATIFDYVNFTRVHHAVEKLRQGNSSVSQIAAECGFSSATYFNRVFKSFFGCSPSVYRKLLTENRICK